MQHQLPPHYTSLDVERKWQIVDEKMARQGGVEKGSEEGRELSEGGGRCTGGLS
jgi:hypothetical protein